MAEISSLSIGFLLGSGVSLPIAPGTGALTDIVRNRVGEYFLHTDEEWYRRKGTPGPLPLQQERQDRVEQLIPRLFALVDAYYADRVDPVGCPARLCNYEDIAYHASALADTLARNRDDPGLMPLADRLRGELGCSFEVLRETAQDTANVIRAVVFMELVERKPTRDHLRLIVDAARDPDIRQLPIYTLNHECLIEDQFAAENVSLFDFRCKGPDGRVLLNLEAPPPEAARAVLYKVHGSVRWRRFRPIADQSDSDPWFGEWVGWERDNAGKRHDDGSTWRSIGPPLFLVGRFNKELDYLDKPFSEMYVAVSESLRALRQVVVSGYGFADKAVNSLLIDWVYARPKGQRRIVVMHEAEDRLLSGARGAVREKWKGWKDQGVLRWIPQFPRDYTWAHLKAVLHEQPPS